MCIYFCICPCSAPLSMFHVERHSRNPLIIIIIIIIITLPSTLRYGVSAWTGGPGVSILWPGEIANLFCNFCLSVLVAQVLIIIIIIMSVFLERLSM